MDSVKLSPEDEKKVRENEQRLRDRAREADAYDDFTERGKPYFFKCIDIIEKKLAEEIMKGEFYTDTKIIARIKDQESALNNDNIDEMGKYSLMRIILDNLREEDYRVIQTNDEFQPKDKKLDDVFGICVIIAPIYNNYLRVYRLLKDTQGLKRLLRHEGKNNLLKALVANQQTVQLFIEHPKWLEILDSTREPEKMIEMLTKSPYMLRIMLDDKDTLERLIENDEFMDEFLQEPEIFNQLFARENNFANELLEREARDRVYKIIRDAFEITEEKEMAKDRYKAIHLQFYENENNNPEWPLIECQIKTTRDYTESREHTLYKVESAIERLLRRDGKIPQDKKAKVELTPLGVEKVYSTIQQYFNDRGFSSASNIPKMWESVFSESKEVMERTMLSEGQTLKEMYKFLDMSGGRDRKGG